MEVRISYSKPQLDEAVRFIARNNAHFQGQTDYIRNSILDHMKEIAADPEQWMGSTMGYTLIGDREDEGIDSDENSIRFEILVDPNLGSDIDADDWVEETINAEDYLDTQ
jgi:hypothetical protein